MALKLSQADIWFSRCIRAAADHTCARCGIQKLPTGTRGSDGLECSHRYGRRARTVRWCAAKDGCATNADCLCSACHRHFEEHPLEYAGWMVKRDGEGAIELLREKWRATIKITKAEEKEISKHYREQHKIIQEKRAEGIAGPIEFESYQ